MKNRYLIMHPEDNCATALEEILVGEEIKIDEKLTVKIIKKIRFGHKFALKSLKQGEKIIKYGTPIGIAKKDIDVGDWVHTRNVVSLYMEGKI